MQLVFLAILFSQRVRLNIIMGMKLCKEKLAARAIPLHRYAGQLYTEDLFKIALH